MKFVPPTTPRERRACGACSNCHPGRQFGGDERCTRPTCTCHQGDTVSDPVPRKQLVALSERDGFVCVWTATQGDRLIPQHRQGGMGGRPDKHRTANLLWLDSLLNGLIEADAGLAEIAKAYGIKVPIWVKDVAAVPVFFAHEHRWFLLEGDTRREITAVDALDRMHTTYSDEYFQWKARADRTPHAAIYAMRTR